MENRSLRDVMIRKILFLIVLLSLTVGMATALLFPFEAFGQVDVSKAGAKKAAAGKTEVSQKAPVPEAPAAIPVSEVATKATEVTNLIQDINAKLTPNELIESIRILLPQKARQLSNQFSTTKVILESGPTLAVLQNQQQLWQQSQGDMGIWLQVLTKRATLLKTEQVQLQSLENIWAKTLKAAKTANAPGPILQQIKEIIAVISDEKRPLEAQGTAVLDLQSKVAHVLTQCNTILTMISQAQHKAVGGILTRDSIPIWSPDLWTYLAVSFPARVREVVPGWRKEISLYLREPAMGLPLHMGLFIALALMFWMVRRRVHLWKGGGEEISSTLMIFEKPFAAALLGSLSIASSLHSQAPTIIKVLFEILAFAPIIRLIGPVVNRRFLPGFYILWVLFCIDAFRQSLSGGQYNGQLILVIEALVGATALMWLLVHGHIHYPSEEAGKSLWKTVLRISAILLFIILATGFVSGLLGYLSLARILVSEVVAGGTMAVALYVIIQVVIGIIAFSLRVWPLRCLHMVMHHRVFLERRAYRVMVLAAIVIFVVRLLDYTGFLSPTLSFFQTMLAFKLERGSVSVCIGDILAFFLTVWAAFLMSSVLRFVLQEDIYPRMGVQKGMAYATSSLINYIILALGFVIGLGVIGVSLTKMTVLIGAFGVGIGFGLQSIVNNFVSGLILLFERPLHVGDTIEMGDLLGEVRRIGIRASIVRTWRGADIVVPNADLITKQVTNWTLGDNLRRIDLPISVSYSAVPQEVIRILEKVAKVHPDVLHSPVPSALFTDYGESSLNFELRAWTDKFIDWPRIRSDLATAIYHAGQEAGISFPFPQREVRILNYSDAASVNRPVSDGLLFSSHPGTDEDRR